MREWRDLDVVERSWKVRKQRDWYCRAHYSYMNAYTRATTLIAHPTVIPVQTPGREEVDGLAPEVRASVLTVSVVGATGAVELIARAEDV